MKITKVAVAGTLESSDVQVRVQPFDSLDIEINSSVAKQFGEQIEATVREVLAKLGITAVFTRACNTQSNAPLSSTMTCAAAMRATDETINWEAVL